MEILVGSQLLFSGWVFSLTVCSARFTLEYSPYIPSPVLEEAVLFRVIHRGVQPRTLQPF